MNLAQTPAAKPLNPSRWARPAAEWLGIALLAGVLCVVALWLHAMHIWWADVLVDTLLVALNTSAALGAYAGWAFDDVDEEEERPLVVTVVALGILLPPFLVLAGHALGTTFDAAPGSWAGWADTVARATLSIAALAAGGTLFGLMARRAQKGVKVLWAIGALFLLALMLLAAWPWLGSTVPVWARAMSMGVLLTGTVLLSRRVPSTLRAAASRASRR